MDITKLHAIRFLPGTKISHDYDGTHVQMFPYSDLVDRKIPAIGIPCKQNRLVVIDVDTISSAHKKDGRDFWQKFTNEFGVPQTYTVSSQNGGYHFYFEIPQSINIDTFSPPGQLADGVDVKFNGWVGAPPTAGYSVLNHYPVAMLPPSMLAYFSSLNAGRPSKTFDPTDPNMNLDLHRPFTKEQLAVLDQGIAWIQKHGSLSRDEWRNGLFALKAGIDDEQLLDEYVVRWSMNQSYTMGDEDKARAMIEKANKYGGVGPASILSIISNCKHRSGAPVVTSKYTNEEIFDKAGVQVKRKDDGTLIFEATESNAAAVIGTVFDDKTLYHDIRTDLYIFQGKPISDTELVNRLMPVLQSRSHGLGLEKFRRNQIAVGLDIIMATRQKDPHVEYLKSLTWDGVSRIENFFPHYVGVESTPYTRLIGLNFWVSLASRGLRPGSKFDSMVVLEGHEGIAKSGLIEAIGGEYTFTPDRKDTFSHIDELRKMHQSVIVELPELMGLINEPAEKVKAFLAKPFDHIRALFAKKAMKHLRGFVFVGTTNSDKYLSAAMGIRRFWPLRIPFHIKMINLDNIRADRDQLYAEAIQFLQQGHPYWYVPKEMLDSIVVERVVDEPLLPSISEIIKNVEIWSIMDVYKRLEAEGLVTRGLNQSITFRIEGALRRLGCEQVGTHWRRTKNEIPDVVQVAPPTLPTPENWSFL